MAVESIRNVDPDHPNHHIQHERISTIDGCPPSSKLPNGYKNVNGNDTPSVKENERTPEPIAVIGLALKFSKEATSPEAFWDLLLEGRTTRSKVPKERYNVDAFYHAGDTNKTGMVNVQEGNFIEEDIAGFDAPFFSLPPGEVECMDPMQRWLLEITYQALQNAGIPMERCAGSKTSVFVGSCFHDYQVVLERDPMTPHKYKAPGVSPSILSNRLSWFYNFKGPSLSIDTACSSSLNAFHLACQSIQNGEADMGIVGGCNLIYNPETSMDLADLGFLSPDGQCYSFDHRANGYARGEGIGVVIVKSLSKALEDGDTIRAVVRGTGANQDGRTPGLTQPSIQAQETLIRSVYESNGLDMSKTMFIEAHGTGTSLGDPIEARAIGNAFRSCTGRDPLYVGAVKANIGHLEGASGVASLIKTILSLEKGVIPPNASFERLNPKIPADELNIKFPIKSITWPSKGLRRASINSFGFGGSNVHVVLDDAYNYLRLHSLSGNHRTEHTKIPSDLLMNGNSTINSSQQSYTQTSTRPRLFIFSAPDEGGLKRLLRSHSKHLANTESASFLSDLAYTLLQKRSMFAWRLATASCSISDLKARLGDEKIMFGRSTQNPKLCFVFTGQGAQWSTMGRGLLIYSVFRDSLEESQTIFRDFGSEWSLLEELAKNENDSRLDEPSICQPVCTALQLALVQLLSSWGVHPNVVIGHSSGEIAAAYCIGALSHHSACKVAFYRGFTAASLTSKGSNSSMLAVGLSSLGAASYLEQLGISDTQVSIACINSQRSTTLSGDPASLADLHIILEEDNIFSKKLPVNIAYHSPKMKSAAPSYRLMLEHITPGQPTNKDVIMYSSLTGNKVCSDEVSNPEYWVQNLVLPVKFSEAMANISMPRQTRKLGKSSSRVTTVNHILEIGPHSALKAAVKDNLLGVYDGTQPIYSSVLIREKPAMETALDAAGYLFGIGVPVNVGIINNPERHSNESQMLVSLPAYPFNHEKKYWVESRLSKEYRNREFPPHEFLGTRVPDWNPLEPRWRNIIRIPDHPWILDHQVNGAIIYPAAGMLVMAIEAAKQLSDKTSSYNAFQFKDVSIVRALVVPQTENGVEVQIILRPARERMGQFLSWNEFRIYMYEADQWSLICKGSVVADITSEVITTLDSPARKSISEYQESEYVYGMEHCTSTMSEAQIYRLFKTYGLNFGPAFQSLRQVRFSQDGIATGKTNVNRLTTTLCQKNEQSPIIHPAALDAFLQLPFMALASGVHGSLPTMVPTIIRNMWISADIGKPRELPLAENSELDNSSVSIHAKAVLEGPRQAHSSIIAMNIQSKKVCLYGDFDTTAVADSSSHPITIGDADRKLCYSIDWKPDTDLMSKTDISAYCSITNEFPLQLSDTNDQKLLLCHLAWDRFLHLYDADKSVLNIADKPHIFKYIDWMRHCLQEFSAETLDRGHKLTSEEYSNVFTQVENSDPEGKLLVSVIKNLDGILGGQVEALEVIFCEGLVDQYYNWMLEASSGFEEALRYVDAFSHQSPDINILEIGAGTGSATGKVLNILGNGEDHASISRFGHYTFTDISVSFFEAAKLKFASHGNKMDHKVLDIEKEPTTQGFESGSYDIIVAANVIHATKNIQNTLENVRKLLKPCGKLLLFEITAVNDPLAGFIFGLLPGWWLGMEESRKWGPLLNRESWDASLSSANFTGADNIFPALHCERSASAIITTAKSAVQSPEAAPNATILINNNVSCQIELAKQLQLAIEQTNSKCDILHIHESNTLDENSGVCISLLEMSSNFIYEMPETALRRLQGLFHNFKTIIWASSDSTSPENPMNALVTGLARSIRAERNDLKFVTVQLQDTTNIFANVKYLSRVIRKTVEARLDNVESEYAEIDGLLHINRITENKHLNRFVSQKTLIQNAKLEQFNGPSSKQLKLVVAEPGNLSSLQYIQERSWQDVPLEPDEIEISVKAIGLNFRDVLIALGQDPVPYLGMECSGIVTKCGPKALEHFQPGDRVCCLTPGCFKSLVRCPLYNATKIPDSISFLEGATLPVVHATAYYALVHIGRLLAGETILIHSGAGGFGQACIQFASFIGAKIFTTVSSEEKKKFLIERYGVAEENIFSSRTPLFSQAIMAMTKGKGVDVIVNSLAGEALRCTWDCIGQFGRFLEVGKRDIFSFGTLPMFPFSKGATFAGVDLLGLLLNKREFTKTLLDACMVLLSEGKICPPSPLNVYEGSKIEDAFRYLESGKSIGKLVIEVHDNDMVPVVPSSAPTYSFDQTATYVISGGLGGIGRSISRWMVNNGARNLILLSRSKEHGESATGLLQELRAKGVCVATPACDVGDKSSLKSALEKCSSMPPIKGCIQGAMVLQDVTFDEMSIADFNTAIKPKVHGSWNLHECLPSGMDFFILLSSVAGIVGTYGQSNYAAGNTYQDALAAFRVTEGEKAFTIDLGGMESVGYIAERNLGEVLGAEFFGTLSERELHAILEYCCDPHTPLQTPSTCQIVTGIDPPAVLAARGVEEPYWMHGKLFKPLYQMLSATSNMQSNSSDTVTNYRELISAAESLQQVRYIIIGGLQTRLSNSLGIEIENIDPSRPMHTFGVDSLSAVEVRTWFRNAVGVDITVFDILGNSSIEQLAQRVAPTSSFITEALRRDE